MGRVSAPFGVKGWVKVQPYTEKVDNLFRYPKWWLATGRARKLALWWENRRGRRARLKPGQWWSGQAPR